MSDVKIKVGSIVRVPNSTTLYEVIGIENEVCELINHPNRVFKISRPISDLEWVSDVSISN